MDTTQNYQTDLFSNSEIEEEIIGMILLDSSLIKKVRAKVSITAFTMQANRLLYRTFLDLDDREKNFNLPEIIAYLNNHQLLDSIGGMHRISSLLNRTLGTSHLSGYIRILLEKQKRRDILALGHDLVKLAETPQLDIEDVLTESKELIGRCFDSTEKKTKVTQPIEITCVHHVRDDRGEIKSSISLSTMAQSVNQLDDLATELHNKALKISLPKES